jgi:hypothetical protein
MRKPLIALTLALTAAAAASTPPTSAAPKCRPGTYLVVCSSTVSICCPNSVECYCPPPES